MSDTYTLRLGPLEFRTTADSGPTEALGNAIEVVGAALTAADPAPKPFSVTVPVGWAGRGVDPVAIGQRARRQVRALLNNTQARMQGLYFAWDIDPDLNGWLIVGGGDLEPGDASGITMGEWKLTLRDCYVAGRRRTHRPAIQASVADRRIATTPRDYLRRAYNLAPPFSTCDAESAVALPLGATDPLTFGAAPVLAEVATKDGNLAVVRGASDGQVISFEQDEQYSVMAGVKVYDRRASTTEADWEAIFGPDQALTAGDVPVIDNGACRVRWDDECLALDAWVGSAWEERGRIPLGTLVTTHVEEWTPERASLAIVVAINGIRTRVYIVVQRGWTGPSIDMYADRPSLRFVVASAETVTYRQPTSGSNIIASGNPLGAATVASSSGPNWIELARSTAADALGSLRSAATIGRGSDTATYGSARSFVELVDTDAGYIAARFALAVEPGRYVFDTFSTNTIANYNVYGTGVSISGGVIVVSSTAVKTLLHRSSAGMEDVVVAKVTTGSSVAATWVFQTSVRATDADNLLGGGIGNTGELIIFKRVAGTNTVLATLPGSTLSARTVYWVMLHVDNEILFATLWTSSPSAGGRFVRSTFYQLSPAEQATFPAGSGLSGMRMTPGGTDWTYDDLQILPNTSAAVKIGEHVLMDSRGVPTLVTRS